jgi:predicted  nucleic acid-binding Zn-ribbon protein
MITGFCRQCKREFHEDLDYYGYCNISCCADFAFDQRITYFEAKHLGTIDKEKEDLEDRVAELECSYDSAYGEASCLNDDLDNACQENRDLKKKVRELESLDWEKIKAERRAEKIYNDSVFRKVANIQENNDYIKKQMALTRKDNHLLLAQNLDLLDSIKKMNSHSERFQQLDLGIELDYDE